MSTPARLERLLLRVRASLRRRPAPANDTWQRLATQADGAEAAPEPFGRHCASTSAAEEFESLPVPHARPGPATAGLAVGAEPVAGYRLVARLGGGGSGEVWRALGPGDFPVALKFIHRDDPHGAIEAGADDDSEVASLDLMRNVRHAHLLAHFGIWRLDELVVVGMELADRTLLDRCHEIMGQGLPGIPFAELIEYMEQAARAIDYLNEPRHFVRGCPGMGIHHGDVKPQNLLLIGNSVKVGDFGLATLLTGDSAPARDGLTPAYAAPEIFSGQLSRRADQYSLAVSYCRLRGGRLPFTGNQWEVVLRHCLDAPDLAMLPAAERPVVARALAKQPEDRWPDCRAFVEALWASPDASQPAHGGPPVPIARPLSFLETPIREPWLDELFAGNTEVLDWS